MLDVCGSDKSIAKMIVNRSRVLIKELRSHIGDKLLLFIFNTEAQLQPSVLLIEEIVILDDEVVG
jgi:DNA helicase TIP49 (TBP-interacting protein)